MYIYIYIIVAEVQRDDGGRVMVLCVPGVVVAVAVAATALAAGGGKERKRLYEEGLTAGTVTAATSSTTMDRRVDKGGNFVGNKGLLLLYCRRCCGDTR